MSGDLARPQRPGRLELLALVALLAPFVVAIVRAIAVGWVPVGDATYYTVRSRDVLTRHWPLVGAWSSGSMVVDDVVNTLGPLQLDLLALFTKAPFGIVSPYLGTGIGSAVINAASVTIIWFVARRLFGVIGVMLVAVGTLALLASLGLSWLIDVRPQHALVVPWFALLWLLVASAAGVSWALPWTVGVAGLLLQTHYTYVYQAALVSLASVVCSIMWLVTQPRPPTWKRPVVAAVAVAAGSWAQPLIDQFWGRGNVGRAIAAGGAPGVGLGDGIRLLAGRALLPSGWPLGSVAAGERDPTGAASLGAALAVASWVAIAVAVTVAGHRRHERRVRALGAASVITLAAGVLASAEIPRSALGVMPQNYYWTAAVAVFLTMALAGAAVLLRPLVITRFGASRVMATACAVGVVVIVDALACWPRSPLAATTEDEVAGRRVAAVWRDVLERAFNDPDFPEVVEIDPSLAGFGSRYSYGVLVELQRSGTEFRFRSGTIDVARFGASRCTPGGVLPRLARYQGEPGAIPETARLLAAVRGIDAADSHYLLLEQPNDTDVGANVDSLDVCGTRVGR